MSTMTTNTIFRVDNVKKTFQTQEKLNGHNVIHRERIKIYCQLCTKVFTRPHSLKYHMKTTHLGEQDFNCSLCTESFVFEGLLAKHVKEVHCNIKEFTCKICGNQFSRLDGLQKHSRSHTGEKPFACLFCNEKFAWTSSLKEHELLHTSEVSFPCNTPECRKIYSTEQGLKRHEKCHDRNQPNKKDTM